jgi:hypothetical protein
MTAWGGFEPGLVCSSEELLFLGNNTVCEAGNLLYLGIDGLIPGGGYTRFFGHPDANGERCRADALLIRGERIQSRNIFANQGL